MRPARTLFIALAGIAAIAAHPGQSWAQDANPRDAAPNALPKFHRSYVPADRIDSGTWSQGYLPIDAEDFRRLVETVNAAAIGAPASGAALMERAEYSARLVGEDLLAGEATIYLKRNSREPAMLDLAPWSPAMGAARWLDRENQPAELGAAADGTCRVLVAGEQLHLQWSLRAERTAAGGMGFELELPRCPTARLTIDLPNQLELLVDEGIATKEAGPSPQVARWIVEFGGRARVSVRIAAEGAAPERRPLILLRQSTTYELAQSGVTTRTQFILDIHGEPLPRIAVELDRGLRLISARYGELQIPFAASGNAETGGTRVILQLPEPIVGTGRVLQLTAIAPLVVGKRWRLPGLKADGMAWQEGAITLLVPGDLVLEQLTTDGCQQSRVAALPAPASGESLEIQCYRPEAWTEVLLAEPRDELRIASGAAVEVGLSQITCRQTVVATMVRGERRVVEAQLGAGWLVDGVEDASSRRALDWEVDGENGTNRLRVRLETSATSTREARFVVRGHRALPAMPAFESGQLMMLAFTEPGVIDRLVSVRGAEGMDLRWAVDADLKRLDPLKLTPTQTQLFATPPDGVLFDADTTFARSTVSVERQRASYAADIRIDAAVHDNLLVETYAIQCTPETSRVDRLIVRFSEDRAEPLEWNLAGANTGQFSARSLTAGEQAQVGLPKGGEAWEVTVQLSRPGPFELRAVRSTELKDLKPICLAQVAEATVQRGTVTIRSIGAGDIAIRNRQLSSVPAELLDVDRYQTARATYQFQPGRDDLTSEPAVSVAPARLTQAASGAWAWHCQLDSRFANDHTSVHWATIGIQTAGAARVQVTLPRDARLRDAWVDNERLPTAAAPSAQPGFAIDLPPGRAFARLTLYYDTPGGLPGLARSVEAPLPRLDVPVLASQWSVWLPPGYEIPESATAFPIDGLMQPSLTQRLFGALGRAGDSDTFNPLVGADWHELTSSAALSQEQLANGRSFLESLGKRAAELAAAGQTDATWGELLTLAAEDAAARDCVLLIDAEHLAGIQFSPRQPIRSAAGVTDRQRAAGLLREARLAVFVWGDTVALTTASRAAASAQDVAAKEAGVHLAAAESPLSRELEQSSSENVEASFRTAAQWQAMPAPVAPPWSPQLPAAEPGYQGDWRAYTMRISGDGVPHVRIVRSAAVQSLAWPIFIAVVAVGIWRRNRPPASLIVFAALSAILALLLPVAYGQLASAAFIGALVGLCLRLIRIPQPDKLVREQASHGSRSRSRLVQRVAGLLLAAILTCISSPLAAQPAAPAPIPDAVELPKAPGAPSPAKADLGNESDGRRPNEEPLYRVFVPVDDQQQLEGGKYYVPAELYKKLLQLSANASGQPKGWLVTGVAYRGELARDPVTKQLRATTLTARIDLQVLSAQADVKMPFPRDAAGDTVVGARLDGRPIPVTWNSTGDALELGALIAERYRLELDLSARLRAYGASAGFDVAIPPIAGATVELSVPSDAPIIEVPTARGQVQTRKDQGRILAHLGGADRLSVRWPAGIGMETATANIEVEELIWVKVRPGTTVFDVRFKYRVLEGGLRQVRLLADPRLQLLPTTNAASPVAAVHVAPGDPQRVDLELSRSVADQVTIDLSFLLTGTSGVGNLQFPRLESSGVRAARRSLAVWVDAALESKEFPGEDTRPMAIADFMSAWGAADTRPQAAYRIPRGEAMWVLATQPSQPRLRADQSLTVGLGRDESTLELDAKLAIDGGYLFQLRLSGPPAIRVKQVSLVEEGVQRVARWATDGEGQTTIFLNGPVTGNQNITVQARMPTPDSGPFEIPRLPFVDSTPGKLNWRIYRQSSLLANVRMPDRVSAAPAAENAEPRDSLGTLVGSYTTDDPSATLTLDIAANSPRTNAVVVTALEHDGDRWMAELNCKVHVEGGVADVLAFQVPTQWVGPYRVEPAGRTRLVPIPGETRQQLLVYPQQPIEGDAELKIRGRVALAAGDRLRVPDVMPRRMQAVERYVVLPDRLDLQQISWETVGLNRATLPVDWTSLKIDPPAATVYRADGDHFQAALRGVQRGESAAQVKLADVHVSWQADGRCESVAYFDVEPAGATSCVLQLPAGHELVHVAVESLPPQLAELGENRWRVTLGPAQLPQRLEVVARGPFEGSGAFKRFVAPTLPELKIGETLWTVYGPPALGVARSSSHARKLQPAEQELHRLKATAALAQLPVEILGEHLPEEIARWYQPWRGRYAAARAALAESASLRAANVGPPPEEIEARQLDAQIEAVDKRLGARASQARAPLRDGADLLVFGVDNVRPLRFVSKQSDGHLELEYARAAPAGWAGRFAVALLVATSAAGAIFLARGRILPKLAPGLVVTLIGLAWWLWLAPSIVGLAIVILGIVLALREQAPAARAGIAR